MKNPFPGIDPYLEDPAFWRDFHQSFITYWRDWLLDHLPAHYDVRIDERLSVAAGDESTPHSRLPDVTVSKSRRRKARPSASAATAVLDKEPTTLRTVCVEDETESRLRVTYRPDASLVAVLELLSPTNKEGMGRELYLTKRSEVLREPAHLVELDLLRGGRRLPMLDPLPEGDYFVFVAPAGQHFECDVYAWGLREPPPRIRIPLRKPDPPIIFDLPGLYAQTYERGRYVRELAYGKPASTPMDEDDALWLRERLQEAQRE